MKIDELDKMIMGVLLSGHQSVCFGRFASLTPHVTIRIAQTELNGNASSIHSNGGSSIHGHLALTIPPAEYETMNNNKDRFYVIAPCLRQLPGKVDPHRRHCQQIVTMRPLK
jgi:hypothetical protein